MPVRVCVCACVCVCVCVCACVCMCVINRREIPDLFEPCIDLCNLGMNSSAIGRSNKDTTTTITTTNINVDVHSYHISLIRRCCYYNFQHAGPRATAINFRCRSMDLSYFGKGSLHYTRL